MMRGLGIALAQDRERFKNEPKLPQPSVDRVQAPILTRGELAAAPMARNTPVDPAIAPSSIAPVGSGQSAKPIPPSSPAQLPSEQPAAAVVSLRPAEIHPNTHGVAVLVTPPRPTPSQPAAQPVAANNAELHAKLAAMEERLAQLTGQREPGDPVQRNGNNQSEAMRAMPARIGEFPAPRGELAAPARPIDPRDANHPNHQDYQRIYDAVAKGGRWDARQSTNIAANVLADFKANPLGKQVNMVAIEPDNNGQLKVFAGYSLQEGKTGCLSTAMADPAQVARVPAERAFERLAQTTQQQEVQPQQRARQQGNDQEQAQ